MLIRITVLFIYSVLWNLSLKGSSAENLQAGVFISNGQNQVNQLGVYRFTLIPPELEFSAGTIIQTTFPSDIALIIDSDNKTDICTSYIDQNPDHATQVRGFDIKIMDRNYNVLYSSAVIAQVKIYPGPITSQSLQVSSPKVSESCTYNFQFKISNDITAGGMIQISFPIQQITIPTGFSNNLISYKLYDQPWSVSQGILQTQNSLIITGMFPQIFKADNISTIQLSIQNIVNPASLQETQSFQISSLNSLKQQIDQATSGMTVKPTIPGTITVSSISPFPSTVGQPSEINFNIQLPQIFSAGYLVISFPQEVLLIKLQCQILIGFATQNDNCIQISSNPLKIRINNQISLNQLNFVVGSIQNPLSNKQTSSFQIQAFDAQDYLQSEVLSGKSYQATPGNLKLVTATRSKNLIGASEQNSLTFNFTSVNPLINGQQILIQVPASQATLTNSGNDFQCYIVSGENSQKVSTEFKIDVQYFQFLLSAPCSPNCPANKQYVIKITGIQNPSYILSSSSSIEIYTKTSDNLYIIDQKKTNLYLLPELQEAPLAELLIKQMDSHTVGNKTEFAFKFSISNTIPANGFFRFYFPLKGVYLSSQTNLVCIDQNDVSATLQCQPVFYSSQASGSSQNVQYIQLSGACTNSCSSNRKFSYKFQNLLNPSSIKNVTNSFAVRSFTQQGYFIDLGNSTNVQDLYLQNSLFKSLRLSFPQSPIITGELSTYTLQISLSNSLDKDRGKIEIIFPSDITISNRSSILCTATVNNQALKCLVDSSLNKIIVQNQNFQIEAGTLIIVSIQNGVYNPIWTKKSSPFQIYSFLLDTSSSQYYSVDQDLTSLTIQPDTANQLKNVSVIRSVSEIEDMSDFIVNFITSNPIPSGSLIIISLPKDQIVLSKQPEAIYKAINQSNAESGEIIQKSFENDIENNQEFYVKVGLVEWCSKNNQQEKTSQCPPNQQLAFKISNARNPSTTKPPELSFKISIQSPEGYYTDSQAENIYASPILSAGPFLGLYMSQTSNFVGDISNLTISVILQDKIPTQQGSMHITLPSNLFYLQDQDISKDSQLQCLTEGKFTNCSYQTQKTNLGSYISTININLNCSTIPCQSNTNRTFQVLNIRNRFNSAKLENELISLAALDGDSYTINAQVVGISSTSISQVLLPNNNAKVLSANSTNKLSGAQTSIQITFQLKTRLQSNSFIQLNLPADQFVQPTNAIQCTDSKNQNFQCNLLKKSDYYQISYQNSSQCEDNKIITITISGFSNQYSTLQSSNPIILSTFAPEMSSVDTTKGDFIFLSSLYPPNITDIKFNLTNNKVGILTTLQLSFRSPNLIQVGDTINCSFSQGVLIYTGNEVCSINSGISNQQTVCNIEKYQHNNNLVSSFSFQALQKVVQGQAINISIINSTNLLEKVNLTTNLTIVVSLNPTAIIMTGFLFVNSYDILVPTQFERISFNRKDSSKLQTSTSVSAELVVPIAILPLSKLVFSIPKTQLIATQKLECQIKQVLTECILTGSNSDYANLTISDLACDILGDCKPGIIALNIQGFSNPQQNSPDVLPIKVWLLSANNNLILDSVSLDINVLPALQTGDLIDAMVSQSGSLITGDLTQYDFKFRFPTKLAQSSQIIIKFPNMTIFRDQVPIIATGDAKLNQKLNFSNVIIDGPYIISITFPNFCQENSCDSEALQQISLSNIRNVEYCRPRTKYFSILAVTQNNFVTNQIDYSEEEHNMQNYITKNFTSMQVVRDSSKLGKTDVTLEISFITPNRIPAGSYIILSIPIEQVILTNYKKIACSNKINPSSSINCNFIENDTNKILLNITNWHSGDQQVNQTAYILIRSAQNPSLLSANYPSYYFGLKVFTTENYEVEEVSTSIIAEPSLTGISLVNIVMSRENNIVGKDDYMSVVIPITTLIDITSDLIIQFPQSLCLQPLEFQASLKCQQFNSINWQYKDCTYQYEQSINQDINYKIPSIEQVKMSNVCSQDFPCKAGDNIIVKFQIRNPLSPIIDQNQLTRVYLRSSLSDLGMGTIQSKLNQLQPGTIKVDLKRIGDARQAVGCDQTGAVCQLEISFTTSNPVPSETQSSASVVIQVPSQMRITRNICSAYLMEQKISCIVNNEQQMTVSYHFRPTQMSQNLTSYAYKIQVPSLQNPWSTKASDSFTIFSQLITKGNQYLIDKVSQDVTFKVNDTSEFQAVKIVRSSTILGANTKVEFDIKSANYIPANGHLLITIPQSQVIRSQQIETCQIISQDANQNPVLCNFFNSSTIKVEGICGTQGCQQGQQIKFSFDQKTFSNPLYKMDPVDSVLDSVIISSAYQESNKQYFMDLTAKMIFLLPELNIEKLSITDIQSTGFNTSEIVDIKFKVTKINQENTFSLDHLRIKFYPPIFNRNLNYEIYASVNSQTTKVVQINQYNEASSSIEYVIIQCDSNCKGKSLLEVQISGLQNPYYIMSVKIQNEPSQLFVQELLDLPNQVLSEGSLDLITPIVESIKLSPLINTLLLQSNPNTTMANIFEVQFTLANSPKIDNNATIQFTFPQQFTSIKKGQQLICKHIFTKKVYECQCDANNVVIISNYFQINESPNTVVAVSLEGISNPAQSLAGIITAIIKFQNQLYAQDNQQLAFKVSDTSPGFCKKQQQCAQCNTDGGCTQCKVPSNYPLLTGTTCTKECLPGYFENDLKCYKCSDGCLTCQTYDQCSTCQPNKKAVDGSCIQTDKCPSGTTSQDKSQQCKQNSNCISQCDSCGLRSNYCYSCKGGLYSLNGNCVAECPQGYYSDNNKQCFKCNSICGQCNGRPDKCTECRKDNFQQSILDLGINSCVSACSSFSTPRLADPNNYCDPCSDKCFTCSGIPNNCTSCYIDKKNKQDLFHTTDNQCVTNCPVGLEQDYSTHTCVKTQFQYASLPIIYLIISVITFVVLLAANQLIVGREASKTSEIALALLTCIEFINRVFLLANLWVSTKSFSFCVTGVDILANSFLGIYFATLVIEPIVRQIQAPENQTTSFKTVVILSQITGINTIRLLTSKFMGNPAFSNKYYDIVYYVKQLELLSTLSSVLCIFQLFTGISCLLDFASSRDSFGIGINTIIFNVGLLGLQTYKYYKSLTVTKVYQSVQRRPQ